MTAIYRTQDTYKTKTGETKTSVSFHLWPIPYTDHCDEWQAEEAADSPCYSSTDGNKIGDVVAVNGGVNCRLIKQTSVSSGKQF